MKLQKLYLDNFRCFSQLELDLGGTNILIYGPNASGKTTIAEAINVIFQGRLLRGTKSAELISLNKPGSTIRLWLDEPMQSIVLTLDKISEGRTKRQLSVNSKSLPSSRARNILTSIIFESSDLEDFFASTTSRRHWFDYTIGSLFPEYAELTSKYTKLLAQKKALLKIIANGISAEDESLLRIYNNDLLPLSKSIQDFRREFLDNISLSITEYCKKFEIAPFEVSYDASEVNLTKLDLEAKLGKSLCGPQFDKYAVIQDSLDAHTYSSRGQKRLIYIVLGLVFAELLQERSQEVLLILDDVLSELDTAHASLVLNIASGHTSIVTTAIIPNISDSSWSVIELDPSKLKYQQKH